MSDAPRPKDARTPVSGAERKPCLTLLVVDDDSAWRDALKEWLEREGFRAVMLARADWIVPAVELHRPDVIVLDVNLPGASGLDVLDGLGRRWPALPVVIMTAFGGPGVGNTARRLGAAAYLEKPFRMGILVDEIRRVASRNGADPLAAEA
jgi:DNA-binding NtrC family response regulator